MFFKGGMSLNLKPNLTNKNIKDSECEENVVKNPVHISNDENSSLDNSFKPDASFGSFME